MTITVQMAEPEKTDMAAKTAAQADTKNAQLCPRRIGILVRTNASEPRPKIGGQNHTDMTRDMMDRMGPSNKR